MRTCSVCRTSYLYCPHCGEDKLKPTWYFSFCGGNCKDIYDVTAKYENGQIDANGAKEKLNGLDLSKVDKFGASYKASIEKINSTTVVEEAVETIIETNDEEIVKTVEEPIAVETVEEEKVIKKSKRAKKNVDVE
jgi:hypothetical protein